MAIIIPALAIAFAAFCVWLAVRIVNRRRERWAKWALVGLIGLPVLYVASFGPACWLVDRGLIARQPVFNLYYPLASAATLAPGPVSNAIYNWGTVASPNDDLPIAWELAFWTSNDFRSPVSLIQMK